MANAVKGEVPLMLHDGRELTLVLDMEALVEAEGAYGKPLSQMMADAAAGWAGAVRALLWAALRAHHPETTLRDASAILGADGEAVAQAMAEAVEAGFPDAAPKTPSGGPEGNAQRPAGKSSGRNGASKA